MVLSNNIEISIINIIASIILFISCVTVAVYYYKADKQDKESKEFNMSNIGLLLCIWAFIVIGLMGINLIRG